MAKQIGVKKAIEEGHLDLHYWAEHVLEQFYDRMNLRGTWPFGCPGPYQSYRFINEKNKGKKDAWVSTGAAAKELYARVWNAASGDTAKVTFFYKNYLDYVQWGVGKGRHLADVKERNMKARFNKVLVPWGTPRSLMTPDQRKMAKKGDTSRRSRPSLKMEFRHQARRLETLVSAYFGRLIEVGVFWNHEFIDIHKPHALNDSGAWIELKDNNNK